MVSLFHGTDLLQMLDVSLLCAKVSMKYAPVYNSLSPMIMGDVWDILPGKMYQRLNKAKMNPITVSIVVGVLLNGIEKKIEWGIKMKLKYTLLFA